MSFRTVLITQQSKLNYKNRFLVVKQSTDEKYIHLSEIDTIIVDSIAVSVSSYLLKELINNKINIVFCDEKHNPFGQITPFYSSHNTSKKIMRQVKWSKTDMNNLWDEIIKNKILNQALNIRNIDNDKYDLIMSYLDDVKNGDATNREGLASKVYFSALFGSDFIRHKNDDINAALNYGYAILLSTFNKEIVSLGYVTQLGIHHKNEFNQFNLSCDLMEPFRILIDKFVLENECKKLNSEYKAKLTSLFDQKYSYNDKKYTMKDIIKLYTKDTLDVLEMNKKYKGFILYEE